MKKIPLLVLTAFVGAMSSPAYAADTTITAQSFAQASLLAIQLAIKHGQQAGKVPAATADCVARFKPDSFVEAFDKLVKSTLSEDEQQATEMFFKSATGAKYTRLNLMQVYLAMGEQAPEPLPEFSSSERAEVESFGKTAAGDKLLVKKAFEQPAAIAAVNQRLKDLLSQCPRK